jgi:DNA-binding NarL/FixJ family response regulator
MGELHALIVEDDVATGRAVARAIRQLCTATLAGTIAQAHEELATGEPIAAMIVDVSLPDGSGIDLVRRTRSHRPLLPVLVLTGDNSPGVVNAAFDLRARFLVKPATTERVHEFMANALSIHGRLGAALVAYERRYGLSGAEVNVLERAARGSDLQCIAAERNSSLETVRKQVASLVRKADAPSLHSLVEQLLSEMVRC